MKKRFVNIEKRVDQFMNRVEKAESLSVLTAGGKTLLSAYAAKMAHDVVQDIFGGIGNRDDDELGSQLQRIKTQLEKIGDIE